MTTAENYSKKETNAKSKTRLPAILINSDFYSKPRNLKWIAEQGYEAIAIIQSIWIATSQEQEFKIKKEEVFHIPFLALFTRDKLEKVISSAVEVGLLEEDNTHFFNIQILKSANKYKTKKDKALIRQNKKREKEKKCHALQERDISVKEGVTPNYIYNYNNNNLSNNKNNNKKPDKESHGHYQRVKLTNDEYQSLLNDLGNESLENLITDLDGYIEAKGATYKNHAATIRNWHRRKAKEPAKGKSKWASEWGEIFDEVTNASK